MLKKLPLGLQSFAEIREDNYLYVDKTEHIYRMIQGKYYFFARPRRFGKSVLCSTLKALYQGKKELFEDLWITKNTDYSFPVHPVIHIDFGRINIQTPELFNQSLMLEIRRIATFESLAEPEMTSPGDMLQDLLPGLMKKYDNKKVVFIIDEYDRPLLHHLTNPEFLKQMQIMIQMFYTCIKGIHEAIQFLFVTGISRFSKTNLFSGFNQIDDISMNPLFAHVVGYTDEELNTVLAEHMSFATNRCRLSLEAFKEKTKNYYNGYRFWENTPEENEIARVYNPYSMLHNLNNPTFKFYWFDSGTPTFLIHLLKKNDYPIESFDEVEIATSQLGGFEPDQIPLKSLLYQAGYLTIKSQDFETDFLTLTYPNFEVRNAFLQQVLVWLVQLEEVQILSHARKISLALKNNDLTALIATFRSFYAAIPYTIHLEHEKYYQTIFYTILKLLGIDIQVEVATNIGRIDALIKTDTFLYIIEFKLNAPVTKALEQIEAKKYFEQYQLDLRPITLIGISFDTKEKNIGDVIIEAVKR